MDTLQAPPRLHISLTVTDGLLGPAPQANQLITSPLPEAGGWAVMLAPLANFCSSIC
jgi:hypothetical protein